MVVYILRSESTGGYYVGATDSLPTRLGQHNAPEINPSVWTRPRGPWKLVFHFPFARKKDALRAERFIKRMKIRAFIEKLIRGDYNLEQILRKRFPDSPGD